MITSTPKQKQRDDGKICEVCGKMYSSKQGMQEHKILEHTKEYKFKCGQCEKGFLSRTRFKSHLLLHLNEKPYACDKCTKAYVHKKDLRNHKLAQHDEGEKFKCDDCNSFFSYKSTLKRHIEAKHKKTTFSCYLCNPCITFAYKPNLLRHQREKHGGNKM